MGQKINPRGFRLGQMFTWSSKWFAQGKNYRQLLFNDLRLRKELFFKLKNAGLAQVGIERSINKIKIVLYVSRPGVVIGRGGSGLEELKKFVEKIILIQNKKLAAGQKYKVEIGVEAVKEPNLNAFLVATNIADLLAKRMPHKRVCNQAIERTMNAGAKGVRILLSGRIAGAEIARREKYQTGTVPLSTLREEVDFAAVPSLTKSGYIGVKVWICRKS